MSDVESGPALGLRERKKLEAMRRIQRAALDLFDRDGYSNVTVEQVAAEAVVSPSSVYRYFGTKERLVLHDEYDPQILAMLRGGPGPAIETAGDLIAGLKMGVAVILGTVGADEERQIERRMGYVVTEPDVKARMTREAQDLEVQIREALGERVGRDPNDLEIRIVVASAVWGLLTAVYYWAESGFAEPLKVVLERTMDIVGQGPDVRLAR